MKKKTTLKKALPLYRQKPLSRKKALKIKKANKRPRLDANESAAVREDSPLPITHHSQRTLKALDLFCGAGGFSLGFQMAGFDVIGGIERDKWACETFEFNHPGATTIHRNITEVSDDELKELFSRKKPDIIVGGPPCQGYSIANKKSGDPKDPRNSLFKEFLRIGAALQPDIMVMENVPNLCAARTASKESVLEIIKQSLKEQGYHPYSTILHATSFGVPQMRQRLFVIGSRFPLSSAFPTPTHHVIEDGDRLLFDDEFLPCPSLWDAISDMPPLEAGEGAEECPYSTEPLTEYQRTLRDGSPALFNHKAMCHTKRIVERFKSMKCGDTINDVSEHLKPRKRNSSEIATVAYDQNNRRMHPERQCHTVPASFYANFVHPFQHRNFTAREGARIQSFPDWFRFLGKPTVVSHKLLAREERDEELHLCQYNQIGNAVPPILAKAVALNIKHQLEKHQNACSRK